jgi:hypothetical protein
MSVAKLTFNPFSSTFDYIYPEDHHGGFSLIADGTTIIVEVNKIIYAHEDIIVDGALILNGTLTII